LRLLAFNPPADTVVLNHANGVGTIAGLSAGKITYVANDVRSVNLTGDVGDDFFLVRSTPGPFATVTINANSGNDRIFVGGLGDTLDTILGPVTVNGGSGTDTLTVLDDGTTVPHTYDTSVPGRITRSGGGTPTVTINFSSIESPILLRGPVAGSAP